ncbi:MAG: MBL fold metallo-hydrolase [Prevotellaceae bacterium]|nr:MBL fold metallo-hydrolase [Prevotellaceae bacterium]
MVEFLCLGSGSSGNCYLLRTESHALLIDAGINIKTIRQTLDEYGFSLSRIEAVLVTHDHADHIKAVGNLANDFNKPVYATEKVHEGMNRNYCMTSKLTPLHQRYISKGVQTQIAGFSVTPFEVSHDSTDCVGYRLEAEGVTFCIVTDCGEVTPNVERAIAEAQYLVIEANHEEDMLRKGNYPQFLKDRISSSRGHLSNSSCAEALAKFATPRLRHVWLCHLSEDNNHPELARKTVERILRDHGIIPGVEFELDVLKRKTPSKVFQLQADED